MFASLASELLSRTTPDVELLPLKAPVINRYVLDDPWLREALAVRDAGSWQRALTRYLLRPRSHTEADVVHSTYYLPHGLVGQKAARMVVTIHDLIPELMPETRRRLDFLTVKKRYVERADHIVCVSEATRLDLLRVYPNVSAPVSVIAHGVDPRFTPDASSIPGWPERYVLFVGHRGQYKDAATLARAFALLAADDDTLHLVFVGGGPMGPDDVRSLVPEPMRSRVHHVTLRDSEMPGAYANAEAFVFPSRFEGFGIPALEAMACGTPAVLARATSLPEIGGDAAEYFEPGDAGDLARVLGNLLRDKQHRAELHQRGLAHASHFTWEKAALQYAQVYQA